MSQLSNFILSQVFCTPCCSSYCEQEVWTETLRQGQFLMLPFLPAPDTHAEQTLCEKPEQSWGRHESPPHWSKQKTFVPGRRLNAVLWIGQGPCEDFIKSASGGPASSWACRNASIHVCNNIYWNGNYNLTLKKWRASWATVCQCAIFQLLFFANMLFSNCYFCASSLKIKKTILELRDGQNQSRENKFLHWMSGITLKAVLDLHMVYNSKVKIKQI